MSISGWGKDAGSLHLSEVDIGLMKLVKSRIKRDCSLCENAISAGSYCLGIGYCKVCLNCYEPFLNNFLDSLDNLKDMANNLINEIKSKNKTLLKNNILAKVNDNNL